MTERGLMAMVVHRATLDEEDDEFAYWLSRPVAERVEAVEVLRRRVFGEADGVRPGFREFVASFIAHDVRFLIVGGYALAAHGLPRATGDLDAWVWVGGDNAQRILSALEEFGFGGLGLAAADFEQPGHVIQLGYPPYRIDILTAIDGVQFEDAWDHRIDVSIGDATAPFIGRTELIANKRAANRPQDIADVERLTRADDQ